MRVYVLKRIYDDDDGGTVIDRKLNIFNNTTTDSRCDCGATLADATTAFVVVFALVVSVLRAFTCVSTRRSIDDGATKIETGESWSVFNLFTPKLDHSLSKSTI